MREVFTTKKGDISGCLDFIHGIVDKQKLDKKEKVRAMLAAEETLVKLDQATREGEIIRVSIGRHLGKTTISMSSRGEAFDLYDSGFFEETTETKVDTEGMSAETEEEIRSLLLKSFEDKISSSYKKGVNRVRIMIAKSRYMALYRTLMGMILGIVCGVLFGAFVPEGTNTWISENVLKTITTLFMSALKIVVGPVVFFSIATSISGFGNMSELGRIGAKTLGFYAMTSVIAVSIGVSAALLFNTGNPMLAEHISGDVSQIAADASNTSTSLLDTIINIVPNNIIRPFLEADMLQIIFLAVICGLAVSLLGSKAQLLSDIFENCNALFLKITTMLMIFIPIATFCSMFNMVLTTGTESLLAVLSLVGTFIACVILMVCVYLVLLVIFARVNPFRVMKKYFPTMVQVFSLCSSNASIPINMNACRDALGIHPRVYSLTIPLGATINMDGCSACAALFTLSFCHVFGIQVTPEMLFSTVVTILLLSVGVPGVPNSGLVVLALLATQLHIPIEVITLVMGIWPIVDMFGTANNCLGDVVGTFSVAKSEKMVDMEIFNS